MANADPVKNLAESLNKIINSTGMFAKTMKKLTKDTKTLSTGFRMLVSPKRGDAYIPIGRKGQQTAARSMTTGKVLPAGTNAAFNTIKKTVGQERLSFIKELTKFIAMPLVGVGSTGSLVKQAGKAFPGIVPNLKKLFTGSPYAGAPSMKPGGTAGQSKFSKLMGFFTGQPSLNAPGMKGVTPGLGKRVVSGALDVPSKARKFAGGMFKAPFQYLGQGVPIGGKGKKFGGMMRLFTKGVSKLTGVPTSRFKEMGKAFKGIAGAGLKAAGIGMLAGAAMQLLAAFNPLKPLMDALTTIVSVFGAILSTAFTPLIEKLYDVLLSPQMLELWERLAAVVMKALDALMPLIDIAMPIIIILLDAFILALEALVPLFPLIEIPLQVLAQIMKALTPILDLLLIPLKLLGPIFELLTPLIEWLITPLEDIGDAFEEVGGVFDTLVDGIYSAISWILDWIALLKGETADDPNDGSLAPGDTTVSPYVPITPGGTSILPYNPGATPSIASLPRLALGGIVSSPTLAMVGERGTEWIIPEEDIGNIGGGQTIVINIQGYVSEDMVIELEQRLKSLQNKGRLF